NARDQLQPESNFLSVRRSRKKFGRIAGARHRGARAARNRVHGGEASALGDHEISPDRTDSERDARSDTFYCGRPPSLRDEPALSRRHARGVATQKWPPAVRLYDDVYE